MQSSQIDLLLKNENWELITRDNNRIIIAEGQEFAYTHPFAIHAKFFRTLEDAEGKYRHLKAMHDYAFPNRIKTWHYWTEDRFRAHCEGWKYISLAGGASAAKSYDEATYAFLFWLAYPKKRTVIVASTTLSDLQTRIWGYILRCLKECAISFEYYYERAKPPKLLANKDDLVHGMFAIAAKRGDDETAISGWIGRHPDDALLVVFDEGTDMPMAVQGALPNLEKGQEGTFQCSVIGNSNSIYDLHGSMSTPKNGWDSIDPFKDVKWETTQDKGVCLFFSCYNSPAIFETDPEKKKKLGRFLITKTQIETDERVLGKNSLKFWRFTLGFWRPNSVEPTVVSTKFLENFNSTRRTEWGHQQKLRALAGLDPAFSYGGDNCILRLALYGVDINGQVILDFKKTDLLFYIKTLAVSPDSIEIQIADQVLKILAEWQIPLRDLAVDCSGQGRALAEVIRLRAGVTDYPIKIYSVQSFNIGKLKNKQEHDVILMSNHELWYNVRRFIETDNLRGLDPVAIHQFTTRLVIEDNGRFELEKKIDYKKRMGAITPVLAVSPDEADGCSLVLQVAMRNYGFTPGQLIKKQVIDETYNTTALARNRPEDLGQTEPVVPLNLKFGSGFTAQGNTSRGAGTKGGEKNRSVFRWF